MSLITRNAKENRSMTVQLMSQNLPTVSGPFGFFVFYVILTISYLRAQTIETSSFSTDSSRPLFEQIEIFSILTICQYRLDFYKPITNKQSLIPSTDVMQLTLTLKMTTAQVVKIKL